MTHQVYEEYVNAIAKLEVLDPDYDFEAYSEAVEELASLKGFPTNCSIESDVIVPVLPKNTPPLVVLNVHE